MQPTPPPTPSSNCKYGIWFEKNSIDFKKTPHTIISNIQHIYQKILFIYEKFKITCLFNQDTCFIIHGLTEFFGLIFSRTSRGTATSLPRSSVWRILTETGSPMEWNSVWILPDTTYRLSVNLSPPIHLTPNWSISWKGKVCWEGPSDIQVRKVFRHQSHTRKYRAV